MVKGPGHTTFFAKVVALPIHQILCHFRYYNDSEYVHRLYLANCQFIEFYVQPKIGFKKTCKINATEVINLRKGLKQSSLTF